MSLSDTIDNPNQNPIRLLIIEFATGTLYLCDRTWGSGSSFCTLNNILYQPLVLEWGEIKGCEELDPITWKSSPCSARAVIDNSIYIGGVDRFTELFATNDPQFTKATIKEYYYVSDTEDLDNLKTIFVGNIEDLLNMSSDKIELVFSGYELSIQNKYQVTYIEEDAFPNADPDEYGKILPQAYGTVKKLPFRAIDVGRVTTISEDITKLSTTIKITDASGFSASGTVLIGIEQITYTSISGRSLLGCVRGANSTEAVVHLRGAMIGEIKTELVFAIDHPIESFGDIYVKGVKQESGTYTTYLDNHPIYPHRAIISFPSWPQIKKEVVYEYNTYDSFRPSINSLLGRVKVLTSNGEIISWDDDTTINFPSAPSGTLTNIYAEYDFDFLSFTAIDASSSRNFYLDGVLVASLIEGTLTEYVTSPLIVKKTVWPTSATKTDTWKSGGICFLLNSAKVFYTSDESETERFPVSKTAIGIPIGTIPSDLTVDNSNVITFPAAPAGTLSEIEITYTWNYSVYFNAISWGTKYYEIDGIRVLQVVDGVQTELMPKTFTVKKNSWQTSVTKTRSTMVKYRTGDQFVVSNAVQTCYSTIDPAPVLTGNSLADAFIGGEVSADVNGKLDSSDVLIQYPSDIFEDIFIEKCSLTVNEINLPSYSAARAKYVTNGFTMGVAILEKPDVMDLVYRIAMQSNSLSFWNAGQHNLKYIESGTTDLILDENRIDLSGFQISYTDRGSIRNSLNAPYNNEWSGEKNEIELFLNIVTTKDNTSITKYGEIIESISFPFVTNETHAQSVLDSMISVLSDSRLMVEFETGYYLTDSDIGDLVSFDFVSNDNLYKLLLGLVETSDLFRIIGIIRFANHIRAKLVQV